MNKPGESIKITSRFLLGSRRADLLAFAFILFLLLLSDYRLRVYYRFERPRKTAKTLPLRVQ